MNHALLVIDVQESFRHLLTWPAISRPDIAESVRRLVALARDRGDLVIWVLHTEPHTGNVFDPATGHVEVLAGLRPDADEPILTKTAHNAFTTTSLSQLLTRHGIGALTTCGIRTEQCVETTTRLASDLGYDVTMAIDATATHPREHPDAPAGRSLAEILADPDTLAVEEIVNRTVYALAGRFARVATVAELETEEMTRS